MSVTIANHAPPRTTQSVAKTADARELIYLDVTSHDGPVLHRPYGFGRITRRRQRRWARS